MSGDSRSVFAIVVASIFNLCSLPFQPFSTDRSDRFIRHKILLNCDDCPCIRFAFGGLCHRRYQPMNFLCA
ncbi:unnamed protein product, partial [Arabidopsis halleri]